MNRTFSNINSIVRKELSGYFTSPAAYVFIVIFLLLSGFFTFMISNFFAAGEASMTAFFQWLPWLYMALVPAVGMPLWSEERRLGTIELLLTMPMSMLDCILGKFLAAWLFISAALLLTFPLVITVAYLGRPDFGVIFCGYIGSILLGGAYLGIASMTSSMTRSQVVSFILSVIICVFLIFSGWPPVTDMLVNWAPVWLVDSVGYLSVMPHFSNMQRGIIDSRDIIYFLSVICFSLWSTDIILKNHKAG